MDPNNQQVPPQQSAPIQPVPPAPEPGPMQPPQPLVPQTPPKKKSPLKIILIIVGVLVGLFIILGIIGAIIGPKDSTSSKSNESTSSSSTAPADAFSADEKSSTTAIIEKYVAAIKANNPAQAYALGSTTFKTAYTLKDIQNGFSTFQDQKFSNSKLAYIYRANEAGKTENVYAALYTTTGPTGKGNYIGFVLNANRTAVDDIHLEVGDNIESASTDISARADQLFKKLYPASAAPSARHSVGVVIQ